MFSQHVQLHSPHLFLKYQRGQTGLGERKMKKWVVIQKSRSARMFLSSHNQVFINLQRKRASHSLGPSILPDQPAEVCAGSEALPRKRLYCSTAPPVVFPQPEVAGEQSKNSHDRAGEMLFSELPSMGQCGDLFSADYDGDKGFTSVSHDTKQPCTLSFGAQRHVARQVHHEPGCTRLKCLVHKGYTLQFARTLLRFNRIVETQLTSQKQGLVLQSEIN